MAIETFDLGSVPENETSAPFRTYRHGLEGLAYRNQLKRMFPVLATVFTAFTGFRLTTDAATLQTTVTAWFEMTDRNAAQWAKGVCNHVPVWWDDAALVELGIKRQ